jgi:hypothetical protein
MTAFGTARHSPAALRVYTLRTQQASSSGRATLLHTVAGDGDVLREPLAGDGPRRRDQPSGQSGPIFAKSLPSGLILRAWPVDVCC